jgi:hypothetical protein
MQEYVPQYYLGQLEIQKDETQVLHRAKWKVIATTAPELVEPLPRRVGNPASGKSMLLQAHMLPPDDRAARIGDKLIGSFRWSFYEYDLESNDELGVVLIYAVPGQEEAIRLMAERFAATMNASFGVDPQLMQWNEKQNQEQAKPSDAAQLRNEDF